MKPFCCTIALLAVFAPVVAANPVTFNLWPATPPDESKQFPPEADQTKPDDKLIAGRRIIKLGNVSIPQLAVYRPSKQNANGAAIIVAPGGGFHILAYDLEGTEVAAWLNSIGITAIVLKYRVPFRDPEKRWLAAVQDAQRAIGVVRSRAEEWGIDPKRVGILGFSAGGHAAGMAALLSQRKYAAVDEADKLPAQPDFVVLIYPGAFVEKETDKLRDDIKVSPRTPPMFLVHADDDNVSSLNSALLYVALKKAAVPAELHIYSKGGHGYGLRETEDPVTSWPLRCEAWLRGKGWLGQR